MRPIKYVVRDIRFDPKLVESRAILDVTTNDGSHLSLSVDHDLLGRLVSDIARVVFSGIGNADAG